MGIVLTGYTLVFVKLGLGILALIFQMNAMGKGNLAPNSALDQVQNYVLGGIIGAVIYNEAIGILQFFLVLIAWTILVMGLRFLAVHVSWIKTLIDGKPVIVVEKGVVLSGACLKHGIRASDLHLKLRAAGISHIGDVKRAVLEQNGQLTIVQFGEENVRYPLITDGVVDQSILELIDRDREWLEEEVRKQGYYPNEVFIAEWMQGTVIVYPYEGVTAHHQDRQ